MDKTRSQRTRVDVLTKLRRRYESAGAEHKRKLLDQAQELLGYHRKAASRAVRAPAVEARPGAHLHYDRWRGCYQEEPYPIKMSKSVQGGGAAMGKWGFWI